MIAAQIVAHDGPTSLRVGEVPDPSATPDQVLIENRAAGVTFPDLLMTKGEYQMTPEFPFVPGSELAGVVKQAPPGSDFSEGDRVVAFPGLGGFAELVAACLLYTSPSPRD